MRIDLADPALLARAAEQPWLRPADYWPAMTAATRELSAPVSVLSLEALAWNAQDVLRRAGGLPVRVASKSLRVRGAIEAVLALPGTRGVLAFSLAEAVWLSEWIDDLVVAYPSADRAAARALGADPRAAARVTVMIDDPAQLDLIDAAVAPGARETIRVCLDFDASWRAPVLGHLGVRRSPVRTPAALRALAETVLRRPGFALVGVMSYEAQIAGVGDHTAGRPLDARAKQWMQRASHRELLDRRGAAIAAVRAVADLEFVNAGGTGSIEQTVADPAVTEVAVGSGLFGPHLFDHYRSFAPAPAVAFAVDVVRRPTPEIATLLGGGWVASGPPGADRLPQPVWPRGLSYLPREAAGEVQTPVTGAAAAALAVGDRVWLRHTKAGELSEHSNALVPISDGAAGEPLPTYRGEGKCFL